MGLGAGLTVVFAVAMASLFIPAMLRVLDKNLCSELWYMSCKCTNYHKCKEWITDKFASCKLPRDFEPVVLGFYVLVGGVSVFVLANYGMHRGIGFLSTLPHGKTETDALAKLQEEFGPGPVSTVPPWFIDSGG
jgi:uncharacterized membrane protein YdfJ with MMPL/SSD domain